MTTFTRLNLQNIDKYMYLKIFVDSNDESLKTKYREYISQRENKMLKDPEHIDAGFDIFVPDEIPLFNNIVNKIDFNIICSAQIVKMIYNSEDVISKSYNTGYYMYPRSSISKTHLRLANNVGIIDAGYRGHLMGMFDIIYAYHNSMTINKYDRLLQICAPGLMPIFAELVNTKEE